MQNNTLIKENIQKLVLHHRKTIINEVVKSGVLREGFEKNKLPKDLTEEQLLYVISECLSEDGNFIIQNYKLLTHPNPTPEMLDESKGSILAPIFKAIPGLVDDAIKIAKGVGKWAVEKVGGVWKWVWKGEGKPTLPKPDIDPTPPVPNGPPRNPFDLPLPDGRPRTPNDLPHNPNQWDVDPSGPYGPDRPGSLPGLDESVSHFNHNMKYLMESNQQIDQNFLHAMLKKVNESKYLLELAIQRNQVNRIIDRI